jgi:hypothetical protein
MSGRQQGSFLPGHPLRMGSADPHHYGGCLFLSHLIPQLRHLNRVLSQALHEELEKVLHQMEEEEPVNDR